jgi:hypothetical protein
MLKYNIILIRRSVAPKTVTQTESQELDSFFAGGKGIIDARYIKLSETNYRLQADFLPGKIGIINGSKVYFDSRNLLMAMYSSSKLPANVVACLKDLEKTIEDDMKLMIESLNYSLSSNQRNVVENDDPSSDRHGSAAGRYRSKFLQLKPKAEAVSDAVRECLNTK